MNEFDFALRLSKLKTEKGVSAREMSLAIGQNEGYINNIETGKANPSLDGIYYICEYLGITLRDFFDTEVAHPAKLQSIISDMKKLVTASSICWLCLSKTFAKRDKNRFLKSKRARIKGFFLKLLLLFFLCKVYYLLRLAL